MSLNDAMRGYSAVQPVWETLDLSINGSGAGGVLVAPSKSVYLWTRCIWHLEYTDNDINWSEFAGATALTNGVDLVIYGTSMLDNPIKAHADFFKNGYDVSVQQDSRVPKDNILSSRWTFAKSAPKGVVERSATGSDIAFHVQDDLRTATITTLVAFRVTLQGWDYL